MSATGPDRLRRPAAAGRLARRRVPGARAEPEAAAAIAEADCDVVAHGWRWIDYQSVGEAKERDHIDRLRARPSRA